MWFARERVRTGQFELERGGKGLKTLLEGAFEDVTNEKQILAGTSPPFSALWGFRRFKESREILNW